MEPWSTSASNSASVGGRPEERGQVGVLGVGLERHGPATVEVLEVALVALDRRPEVRFKSRRDP
jgi:hypothetical protein